MAVVSQRLTESPETLTWLADHATDLGVDMGLPRFDGQG
jgi:hypothetical protein